MPTHSGFKKITRQKKGVVLTRARLGKRLTKYLLVSAHSPWNFCRQVYLYWCCYCCLTAPRTLGNPRGSSTYTLVLRALWKVLNHFNTYLYLYNIYFRYYKIKLFISIFFIQKLRNGRFPRYKPLLPTLVRSLSKSLLFLILKNDLDVMKIFSSVLTT